MRVFRGLGALGALLLAGPALAQHAGKHDQQSEAEERGEEATVQIAGQTASIDKATGKLRPLTPAEARALLGGVARFVDQSSDGLVTTPLASGGFAIDLEDRFQSVTMAKRMPDGSVAARCVSSMNEAEAFLGYKAPAKAEPKQPARKAKKAAKSAAPKAKKAQTLLTAVALEEK